jgi:hypothetical protein
MNQWSQQASYQRVNINTVTICGTVYLWTMKLGTTWRLIELCTFLVWRQIIYHSPCSRHKDIPSGLPLRLVVRWRPSLCSGVPISFAWFFTSWSHLFCAPARRTAETCRNMNTALKQRERSICDCQGGLETFIETIHSTDADISCTYCTVRHFDQRAFSLN